MGMSWRMLIIEIATESRIRKTVAGIERHRIGSFGSWAEIRAALRVLLRCIRTGTRNAVRLLESTALTLLNSICGEHLSSKLGSAFSQRLTDFLIGALLSDVDPIETTIVVSFPLHESNVVAAKVLDKFHRNLWLETSFGADVFHLMLFDDLFVRNVAFGGRNRRDRSGFTL